MSEKISKRTAKETVMLFFSAANEGDMDTSMQLFADELVWTDIGTTRFAGRYEGKTQVMENMVGPLFSQLEAGIHTTIENVIFEGEQVVVQSTGRAKTLDGTAYENAYCQIFTVRNGKIIEVVEYCDTALVNAVFGTSA